MSLDVNIGDIKDYKKLCYEYQYMTEPEDEAVFEDLVNPPRTNIQHHEDGSTSWSQEHPPNPWSYVVDDEGNTDKTRITRRSNLTFVMIFACSSIQMGTITEDNWKKFWVRLHMYEKALGCFLGKPITPDQVRAHIGLTTNVHTSMMKTYLSKFSGWVRDEAERELSNLLEEEGN